MILRTLSIKMFNANKLIQAFIAISGTFSVLFGAWLSHGASHLPDASIQSLTTAIQYQLFHTVALLSLFVWYNRSPQKQLLISICLMILGMCLFSGGIYIKYLTSWHGLSQFIPLGGISLALAWGVLIIQGKSS